jgi:LysM repeat protein
METAMELKPDFSFKPLPAIQRPLRFSLAAGASPLGPLQELVEPPPQGSPPGSRAHGIWIGKGFNVIWRPNSTPGQDRFLELNLTDEVLEFEEISGEIPNRGLLQADINMFGVTYLQQIKDGNNNAGLHIEPGIWATIPQTENPAERPTVVRIASIPHGTTVLAQGIATPISGLPVITNNDIIPFVIGNSAQKVQFPEADLSKETRFRSLTADIAGITQEMVDNPNSVLLSALSGKKVNHTTALEVSSSATAPVVGGGVANTAFLQGSPPSGPNTGPNAQTALVTAIFWIETVDGLAGGPELHQLQYSQTVLLNFNGLSWPHITVATLQRSRPYTVKQGDTLSSIALQVYGSDTEPSWRTIYDANVAVIGPDPHLIAQGQQLNIPT